MSFALPYFLWLLLVPALLAVVDRRRRLALEASAWPGIRRLWAGPRGLDASRNGARLPMRWRLWLGLALLVAALARPQWGKIEERVFDQSREVLLALDLSRSMLSTDVKPARLDRARLLVESLLDKLKGERVGLLVFSGTAFLQCPLSPDYEVLRERSRARSTSRDWSKTRSSILPHCGRAKATTSSASPSQRRQRRGWRAPWRLGARPRGPAQSRRMLGHDCASTARRRARSATINTAGSSSSQRRCGWAKVTTERSTKCQVACGKERRHLRCRRQAGRS